MQFLKSLFADPLFVRVCMAIWAIPFLTLGVIAALEWRPEGVLETLGFACVELIGVLGAYLLYTAFLGSQDRLEKAADFMADGGDIVGAVFTLAVAILAVPITLMLRAALARAK